MQDIDGGLPEMYGPNKLWDKHKDYYFKETARISWYYYSIIVPGFSKLDGYNTFKFLSRNTFPSAFFSPLLSFRPLMKTSLRWRARQFFKESTRVYWALAVGEAPTPAS